MDDITRSKYANYIADAIRYAESNTGKRLPTDTIITAQSYSQLCEIDDIIGIRIYATSTQGPYEFGLSFHSSNEQEMDLLKSFNEYLSLYDINE